MSEELHTYTCPDCEWTGLIEDMAMLKDVHERVMPGELHPAGQCPNCEALLEVADQDVPDHTLDAMAKVMAQRGWTITKPAVPAG